MTTEWLIELLRCPLTGSALSWADSYLIGRVNLAIRGQQIVSRAGTPITEPLDEGLINQDHSLLYPVRASIPALVIDEAISMAQQALQQDAQGDE